LAGVGVAFKLAQFLYQQFFGISASELYSLKKNLFPIVCIGTFADRVVLRGENRIFCKYGMEVINSISEPWVTCLKKEGDVNIQRVLKEVIPTIGSAAYRDPRLGVDFFMNDDLERVIAIYGELRATDQKRKQEIDAVFSEVITSAEVMPKLVISIVPLSKQHYLGSIASRLRDYYKRNSVIIGVKDEKCVGELRSCGLDLYKLLFKMRNFFGDFGGHKKAAGFSMNESNLTTFLDTLKGYVQNQDPDIQDECNASDPTPETFLRRSDVGMLKVLAPFGEGNPAPILTDGTSVYTIDNTLNLNDIT
jgi:single-stranded-DNA-specific exonuclease